MDYRIILLNHVYIKLNTDLKSKVLEGLDMEKGKEGGTWLAMSKTGKIACLLNILQPKNEFNQKKKFEGRGFLVVDYLVENISGPQYMKNTTDSGTLYNDFNYITLEPKSDTYSIHYYNNSMQVIEKKNPGINGFGNCYPGSKWNKVAKGENKMSEIIEDLGTVKNEDKLINALFSMMADKNSTWPDKVIAEQGRGYEDSFLESLSSICVENPKSNYGTRTTTVILVDWSGRVMYKEKNMEGIFQQKEIPLQSEGMEAKEPGLVDITNVNWNVQSFDFFLEN
ncbi:unnamed protein product, partial [Meganyctiphanes norvegica]